CGSSGGTTSLPTMPSTGIATGNCDSLLSDGISAFQSSSWGRSIELFEKAAESCPARPEPWLWLGKAQLSLARYEEARASWDKGLQLGGDLSFVAYHAQTLRYCFKGTFKMSLRQVSFYDSQQKKLFEVPVPE